MSRRITHFETHGKVMRALQWVSLLMIYDLGGQMFVFRRHSQEMGQMLCKFITKPSSL